MKSRTIVISDLHIGGGPADPGDDHVYQNDELVRFVDGLRQSETGQRGQVELFINGDFLEFAQTLQGAYRAKSSSAWCNESESLEKLKAILQGHPKIFAALGAFVAQGNALTVAAGNHDVDLYWPSVQKALTDAVHPQLALVIGQEWVSRHDGRLQIAHGHIPDPVNTFKAWGQPISRSDPTRLEMCPGTLFMVKFVNLLEKKYPFADNIYPVQRLANLLASADKTGLLVVSWAFLRFSARHAKTLQAGATTLIGQNLMTRLGTDPALVDELARLTGASRDDIAAFSEDEVAEFVLVHWPEIEHLPVWKKLENSNALGDPDAANSLGILLSSASFGKQSLQDVAFKQATTVEATEVVVLGHTHLPDDFQLTSKARYFNPGSWTRYADASKFKKLTLDDLLDESRYPYALNYVQVDEQAPGGALSASLMSFEKQDGPKP